MERFKKVVSLMFWAIILTGLIFRVVSFVKGSPSEGALSRLDGNRPVVDEPMIVAAGAACYREILRRLGNARASVVGPCRHEGTAQGVSNTGRGYDLRFKVESSGRRDVRVQCEASPKGEIFSFVEGDEPFAELSSPVLCSGHSQLF